VGWDLKQKWLLPKALQPTALGAIMKRRG